MQPVVPSGAVANLELATAAAQPQAVGLKPRQPRKPDTSVNSGVGQSKKSLNQDLSHLPFVPPAQQL